MISEASKQFFEIIPQLTVMSLLMGLFCDALLMVAQEAGGLSLFSRVRGDIHSERLEELAQSTQWGEP